MTRTVREKAIQLLAKATSDLNGNEKKIADALVEELRVSNLVFEKSSFDLVNDHSIPNIQLSSNGILPKSDNQTLH
jgi:hypothetical protein